MRIALIHALRHSPAAIGEAFARLWPEPKLMNLLDDSLSADLDRDGSLTPAIFARFMTLSEYAVSTGADAILFTCSAFGPCIDAVVAAYPNIPVLKPNEAMIEEAKAGGTHVGLLATFAGTLRTMPGEFPPEFKVTTKLAEGAMAALDAGNAIEHDFLAAKAALALKDCDVIALGQFSLARAATAVATATGKRVLTTPDSAVLALKRRLLG